MVADIEDVTVAGYVEGINRARCTSGSHGLPVHWIDDIASLAAGHKAVAAIGDPRRRAAILKMEEMGFEFVTLVHPTAHLARSVERGIGTVVGPGAVLAAAVVVGPDLESGELLSLQNPKALRLAVTLEAEGTDPRTEEFPLDAGFVQELLEIVGLAE